MNTRTNAELRKQGWNTHPQANFAIPSSDNPLVNASRAIAVSAYPQRHHHMQGGKAEKYSAALLANILRILKRTGEVDGLPDWVKDIRSGSMEAHLASGRRNLMRAFTIRDLINSAVTMKAQHDQQKRGEIATFQLRHSPDLDTLGISLPMEKTVSGYILSGRVPDTDLASLRAAILYHRPALERFSGPAVIVDGRDPEGDYQNAYTRHVRPALFAQHIVQLVWEQAIGSLGEAEERDLSIDELLMRQPEWALDIHTRTSEKMGTAIFNLRELGVATCACAMVQFAAPLSNS